MGATPEYIGGVLSSDVTREESITRQAYQIQREMRAAAAIDPRETSAHRIAELTERIRTLEARVARLEGVPVDPVERMLLDRRDSAA
jgi:hypothetical protein